MFEPQQHKSYSNILLVILASPRFFQVHGGKNSSFSEIRHFIESSGNSLKSSNNYP